MCVCVCVCSTCPVTSVFIVVRYVCVRACMYVLCDVRMHVVFCVAFVYVVVCACMVFCVCVILCIYVVLGVVCDFVYASGVCVDCCVCVCDSDHARRFLNQHPS